MRTALRDVFISFSLCIAVAACGVFDSVLVDVTYDHYAERRVERLPAFLAMPLNSLVNLGYIIMGMYWLLRCTTREESGKSAYIKDVFALMAIAYGPMQWVRLATLNRLAAVLDQWVTLPIFAWVPVWCRFITHGWHGRYTLTVVLISLASYSLALLHDYGFEAALACHVALAAVRGFELQRMHGDTASLRYLILALLSCSGFVVLKLLDLPLSRFLAFRYFTGHFWSKVCDILQFHYSFCFLTRLTRIARKTDDQRD